MAGDKESFSLNESQTTKTSFKINKVPTNADALTLANQGAFGAGEFVITPDEDVNLSQMRMVELWSNSNPSVNFNTQTITLSSSDYDYYVVLYSLMIGGGNLKCTICKKGQSGFLDFAYGNNSAKNINGWRSVSITDDTHLTISDATLIYPANNTYTNNEWAIPYQILGLKKTPAMIYTGAELFAGDGIDIKDGVISTKSATESQTLLYSSSGITSGTITLGNISPYKFLVFLSSDDNGYKTINTFSVKSFISLINNGYLGLYGYSNYYINSQVLGSIENCSYKLSGDVYNQKLLQIWGVK